MMGPIPPAAAKPDLTRKRFQTQLARGLAANPDVASVTEGYRAEDVGGGLVVPTVPVVFATLTDGRAVLVVGDRLYATHECPNAMCRCPRALRHCPRCGAEQDYRETRWPT